jgi:hypothetical protein
MYYFLQQSAATGDRYDYHPGESDDSDPPPTLVSDSSSGDSSDDEGPDLSNFHIPKPPVPTPAPAPEPPQLQPQGKTVQAKRAAQKKKEAKERQKLKKKQREEEIKQQEIAAEQLRVETERKRVIAEKARMKLEQASALRIQTQLRRFLARQRHGAELKARLEQLSLFKASWGKITRILKRNPGESEAPALFSWFEEKNRFDMVLYASDMAVAEEDGALSDQQKIFQTITTEEIRKESTSTGGLKEGTIRDVGKDMVGDFINSQARELSLDELGISSDKEEQKTEESPFISESSHIEENAAAVLNVEFTETVMKWLQNADSRYREMFSDRIERLAQGERSYMLAKRLKGCTSPVFETKLDAGQRILWTQLRRSNENPSIIVSTIITLKFIVVMSIINNVLCLNE